MRVLYVCLALVMASNIETQLSPHETDKLHKLHDVLGPNNDTVTTPELPITSMTAATTTTSTITTGLPVTTTSTTPAKGTKPTEMTAKEPPPSSTVLHTTGHPGTSSVPNVTGNGTIEGATTSAPMGFASKDALVVAIGGCALSAVISLVCILMIQFKICCSKEVEMAPGTEEKSVAGGAF